jgi:hypothetical protein
MKMTLLDLKLSASGAVCLFLSMACLTFSLRRAVSSVVPTLSFLKKTFRSASKVTVMTRSDCEAPASRFSFLIASFESSRKFTGFLGAQPGRSSAVSSGRAASA